MTLFASMLIIGFTCYLMGIWSVLVYQNCKRHYRRKIRIEILSELGHGRSASSENPDQIAEILSSRPPPSEPPIAGQRTMDLLGD